MEKDLVEKRCLSDNRRYADLINGFVFQGKQILHETDLRELDTQTGSWGKRRFWKRKNIRTKYRDLLRKAALGINFAVIGVENQEEVDYLMPLRSMGYDVGEYERQALPMYHTGAVLWQRMGWGKGFTCTPGLYGYTPGTEQAGK